MVISSDFNFGNLSPTLAALLQALVARANTEIAGLSGGTLADGSVSTAKLADSAVTAAKITDATITPAKLSYRPASNPASDLGLITEAFPVEACSSQTAVAAGTLAVVRMKLLKAETITNLHIGIGTAGSGLTAGQCFAALYQGGARLGVTADQAASWASSGGKIMAISGGPVAAVAGDIYVAWWANGSTPPSYARGFSTATVVNRGLTGSSSRYATADTGLTTTAPTSIGAMTATSAYWAGVS